MRANHVRAAASGWKPAPARADRVREFAAAFRVFLDWIHAAGAEDGNEVPTLARDFLGPDTGAHMARALDDLLDAAQAVTRTLLGVGADPLTCRPAGRCRPARVPARRWRWPAAGGRCRGGTAGFGG